MFAFITFTDISLIFISFYNEMQHDIQHVLRVQTRPINRNISIAILNSPLLWKKYKFKSSILFWNTAFRKKYIVYYSLHTTKQNGCPAGSSIVTHSSPPYCLLAILAPNIVAFSIASFNSCLSATAKSK